MPFATRGPATVRALLIAAAVSAVAVAALLLAGCTDQGPAPRGAGGPPGGARGPTPVVAENATLRLIREEVEAVGTASANESVMITAKVTDTVSRVSFEDGDRVTQGQVLLELTNREETALLAEAQANLDDASRQLARLEDLYKQRTVPLSQVDEARARFKAAEARYQSVVARLADRLISAPFAGVLGFRRVSEGTLITPGTPIATLDDLSIIKLDFSLPETHLNLLQMGMQLSARSAAFPNRTFSATVRTIESRVDPVTRAATVRAHIDNADLLLRPGMLLTVRLVTAERQALMVPEDALVQRSNQAYVYTIEDRLAQMRQVSHGTRHGGWVEILAGLDAGEPVITEGVIKIRPGAPVDVRPSPAPAAGSAPIPVRANPETTASG
ncbi:MAG: efflux RND transporter periplasmic adaptor subunit [Pseudomonadales bacterium]